MTTDYTLDGGDADLRRLLAIADVTADMTRQSLARAGLRRGGRALDCGCGPLGALPILADQVGPDGVVVGVDANADALSRARAGLDTLKIRGVGLVCGDVHDLASPDLGGPFDVIYTRCFLMHQPDPTDTLRHLATLLHPGGWIVANEPMRVPPPAAHPHHPAVGEAWSLLHTVLARAGVPDHAVESLPRRADLAGLDVMHAGGTWILLPPEQGFQLHAATLSALRDRAVGLGVDPDRIDVLVDELQDASEQEYEWVSTPQYLDVAFRRRGSPAGPVS